MEKTKQNQTTDNAKKAFTELTSLFKSESKSDEKPLQVRPRPETLDKKEATNDFPLKAAVQPNIEARPVSIISINTEIAGNISTQGDLEIAGYIEGNVVVSGKVTVVGSVKGNIEAEELIVKQGTIASQTINIKKAVILEEGSDVAGNIRCERAMINAKVTGNVTVLQTCAFQAASYVQGDIEAKELSVQSGAILLGKIAITRETGAAVQKEAATGKMPVMTK